MIDVMSDHQDYKYWKGNYINFTLNRGNCKLYTNCPWDVERDNRDIVKCAFIIEPYYFKKKECDYVYNNYQRFDYVLTHDDRLLTLPNALLYYWGGSYSYDSNQEKTKNISIISSDYTACPLHSARKELAFYLKNNGLADTYGTFDGGPRIDTITAHAPYRFAIAIENYIENYWWTEKINNCFLNRTVPIYIGARKIDEIFNPDGIIQVHSTEEIKDLLVNFDYVAEYEKRRDAIEANYSIALNYANVWDQLYLKYGKILRGEL